MSLLFESIRCHEGNFINLDYHEKRLNRSRQEVLKFYSSITLKTIIVPEEAKKGLWKCRVSYAAKVDKIEFSKYSPANPRAFKLVTADIQYDYKFEDRAAIDTLFARRGTADDIVIVVDGQITDSSYGNLIFKRGEQWLTPIKPLLPGTMRAALLDNGKITPEKITPNDLSLF